MIPPVFRPLQLAHQGKELQVAGDDLWLRLREPLGCLLARQRGICHELAKGTDLADSIRRSAAGRTEATSGPEERAFWHISGAIRDAAVEGGCAKWWN